MKIIIRECLLDDYKELYIINKEEMGYTYPKELMKEKLKKILKQNTDKIFVAVIENKVVGYVHANDYDVMYIDHMKNIMGIAVSSSYKHLGIGRKLLTKIEEWARNDGASKVRLVSGETRVGAHEFYKRCGYVNDKKQLYFIKKL